MPNPLPKKMEYYNELTIELYEGIYGLIPYLQFKSYLLGQKVTTSKVKDSTSNIISKVDKMLDAEYNRYVMLLFSQRTFICSFTHAHK